MKATDKTIFLAQITAVKETIDDSVLRKVISFVEALAEELPVDDTTPGFSSPKK